MRLLSLICWCTLAFASAADAGAGELALHVAGSHLVDSSGARIQLRGVSVSGLESIAVQGWSTQDPWAAWKPHWPALQEWRVNAIRLPMNEASWIGYTCKDATGATRDPDPGHNYRAAVARTVAEANAAGIYVILELHWSAPGSYCPLGQNVMADADHSPEFWTSVADAFRSAPGVAFELFNEPYLSKDAFGWDAWLHGGGQTQIDSPLKTNHLWRTVGMQVLIDAVREAGATNVILVGGLGYANDLTGWTANPPHDALGQLAAAWHVYSDNGYTDTAAGGATQAMLAEVAKRVPLVITEVGDVNGPGAKADFAPKILTFADREDYSYFGWTWNFWGQSANNLILDAAGTPTLGFGTYFKQHLVCRAAKARCP